jgi:hypothetical protein
MATTTTYDFAGLVELATAAGVTGPDAQLAAAIAMAESGGNPRAVSLTGDYGLWQVNARSWPQFEVQRLLEPAYNAAAMAIIARTRNGWDHWSVHKNGRYKNFLPGTTAATGTAVGAKGGGFFEDIAGDIKNTLENAPGTIIREGGEVVEGFTGAATDAVGNVVGEAISGVATLALSLLLGATGLALAGLGLSGLARTSTTGQRTIAAGQGAAAGAPAGPAGAALGAAAGVASLT